MSLRTTLHGDFAGPIFEARLSDANRMLSWREFLDLINHKLVKLLGSSDFHNSEYVAGAPTRVGHLHSRQTRHRPSNVAGRARLGCNDDIGSHRTWNSLARLVEIRLKTFRTPASVHAYGLRISFSMTFAMNPDLSRV